MRSRKPIGFRQWVVHKDDWRLTNNVEYLKNKEINPTDGEEISRYATHLKKCIFCWETVKDTPHQWWFIPEDLSCCICEECYNDFNEMFNWKKLDGWDIDWTFVSKVQKRVKSYLQSKLHIFMHWNNR